MRQYQICAAKASEFGGQFATMKNKLDGLSKESILIYVNWTIENIGDVPELTSRIEQTFPGILYYGCETFGNICNGELASGICVTFFVFEGNGSKAELVWVDEGTELSNLDDLWNYCNTKKGLKAVELIPTVSCLDTLKVENNVPAINRDIKVFGGANFSLNLSTNQPCIISSIHPMSNHGMVAVLYFGKDLEFSCTHVLGWKGLGSFMKVTDSSGKLIKSINGLPAFSSYEKYLNLRIDDSDMLIFPLIVQEDGYEFIRTPLVIQPDKSMVMLSNIKTGSNVRIAFGDKNTILSTLYDKAKEIAAFGPQVIKAFSCGGRRLFWSDDEISKETMILQHIAPVSGFYTGGEIMQFGQKIHALNQTLVIVSVREKGAAEVKIPSAPKENPDKSLVARLAYFVEKVSKEQDEAIETISGLASEYQSLYYINLEESLFNVYSIDGIKLTNTQEILGKNADIFDLLHRSAKLSVHPDDISVFNDITYDSLVERLSNTKKITARYRKKSGDDYIWSEIDIVKREEKNEPVKSIILGFAERDEEIRREVAQRDELKSAYEAAEIANKSKSRFLFNMSHDIRTPMNAITGFTDMAKKNIGNKEKVNDYLNKIDLAGKQLLNLINQVLEMSRIESGKVEMDEVPIDLDTSAEALLTILVEQAKSKGIKMIPSMDNITHHHILSDTAVMAQIAMNLGGNAIKYTPAGGTIRISLTESPSDRDGYAHYIFTVSDNGIGMSEEFQKTIFEPFSREKNSTVSRIQGTGLGMSIVKSLVDLMGGTIEVNSKPGQGTTFKVCAYIRIDDLAEAENKRQSEISQVDFTDKRVLLVEDNELNREIARFLLEEKGFIVKEAVDGKVAVDIIMSNVRSGEAHYFDFILMDVQMPEMDGYQATARIRELLTPEGYHIPIIALSANAFEEDKLKSTLAGMNDHVAKPIDSEILWATMAKYL